MSTPWHRFPRGNRKPVRDYHRPRYGNPLFPTAAASSTAASKSGRGGRPAPRTTRRGGGDGNWLTNHPFLAAAIVLLIGGGWYAFFGPAFRISEIQFSGATASTEEILSGALDEHLETSAFLVFPRNNVLLFGEDAAKDAIANTVYLDDITIRKKLPNTLMIEVKEKTMLAVLEHEGRLLGVDDAGYVLRELTGKERELMPDLPPQFDSVSVVGLGAQEVGVTETPVTDAAAGTATEGTPVVTETPSTTPPAADAAGDATATPPEEVLPPKNAWPLLLSPKQTTGAKPKTFEPGTQAFSPDTVNTALQANARLPDVTGEIARWFVPDEAADTLDVTMAKGWHIYLSSITPFEKQSANLSIVLSEKIGAKRPSLEYIDLRYNERIFFRLTDGAE